MSLKIGSLCYLPPQPGVILQEDITSLRMFIVLGFGRMKRRPIDDRTCEKMYGLYPDGTVQKITYLKHIFVKKWTIIDPSS